MWDFIFPLELVQLVIAGVRGDRKSTLPRSAASSRRSVAEQAGSLHENGPPRNSKNLNFFLSQNTFICIHICKQVFKVTKSEFFHKSIKNCKNGNLMKFKYKKKMVPYVTQAYSGITVGV